MSVYRSRSRAVQTTPGLRPVVSDRSRSAEEQKMSLNTDWAKWQKVRRRGFLFFVCIYGALGWGLISGVLFAAIFAILPFVSAERTFSIALPAFVAAGLVWGAIFWIVMEWMYRRSPAFRGIDAK